LQRRAAALALRRLLSAAANVEALLLLLLLLLTAQEPRAHLPAQCALDSMCTVHFLHQNSTPGAERPHQNPINPPKKTQERDA
jgi:hypothetical protein